VINALLILASLALPWLLGTGLLLAAGWPREANAPGAAEDDLTPWALRIGYGYTVGALLLTLWMRAASAVGVGFGRVSIALPLAVATAALFAFAWRRGRIAAPSLAAFATLPRWQQVVAALLLVWMALRFGLLGAEIAWRPLYPWDAWIQWATKARVWYETGRLAPFVDPAQWLAGASGYTDASPNYPATVPLLQVWTCVMLGAWNDSAMNWPWLALLLSLCIAIYGVLRGESVPPLAALIGAYLVASLPLLDVHVALAGYADLPQAVVYALAALATYRWCVRRQRDDAAMALFLGFACILIKNPGIVWTATLLPALVVTLMPRHGLRYMLIGAATIALVVVALAQSGVTLMGYPFRLDFSPAWRELARTYLLMGNWNLLWYAVLLLCIASWRYLLRPPLLPLTVIVLAGAIFLFIVFSVSEAAAWMADLTTANRATLHLAPLLIAFAVIAWNRMRVGEAQALPSAAAA
jgi:hypothetical protein